MKNLLEFETRCRILTAVAKSDSFSINHRHKSNQTQYARQETAVTNLSEYLLESKNKNGKMKP